MLELSALLAWRPGRLAMNTLRGSAMYGIRLAVQALYFVVLARYLGVHQFGVFSGIWVLCGFLATFAGMGFPVLAFRTAAVSPAETANCAARGLQVMALTALPLSFMVISISTAAFPASPSVAVLAFMALSEIVLVPVLTLLSSTHQGNERLARAHALFASLWAGRLLALLLLPLAGKPDLLMVMSTHALVTALVTVGWAFRDRGLVTSPFKVAGPARGEILTGASFAVSGAALIAYTELNQSITLALSGATAAGLLAVAYKLVAMASAPLAAMCQAISPRLLRAAQEGHTHFARLVSRIFWPMLLYAMACGAAIFLGAGLIGLVFGDGYAGAKHLARPLCILPIFTSIRLLSVYILMAKSRQASRVVAEIICLIFGLSLNFLLIAKLGTTGAVVALLATEASTAAVLSYLVYRMLRRQKSIANSVDLDQDLQQ
jgi:O-antigen/teichoic acid export membrane protein